MHPRRRGYSRKNTEIALEERVTVCIAAECWHEKKAAIVLCCDWQGTKEGFVKSDYVDKIRWVDTATVMIAGGLSEADELVNSCTPAIHLFARKNNSDTFDLDINGYLEAIRSAAAERKAARVRHHIAMSLGIDADEFWKHGKDYLSAAQHDEVYNEIRGFDLGASLLLCSIASSGEPDDEGVIIRLGSNGHVSWEPSFSTIGSGGPIAEAFLHQYDFDQEIGLMECLYRVFSAKVAAEKNPQVGETTSFEILMGRHRYDVSDEGFKYLKQKVMGRRKPKLEFKQEFVQLEGDETKKDQL